MRILKLFGVVARENGGLNVRYLNKEENEGLNLRYLSKEERK